jgi:hypothetical protein
MASWAESQFPADVLRRPKQQIKPTTGQRPCGAQLGWPKSQRHSAPERGDPALGARGVRSAAASLLAVHRARKRVCTSGTNTEATSGARRAGRNLQVLTVGPWHQRGEENRVGGDILR